MNPMQRIDISIESPDWAALPDAEAIAAVAAEAALESETKALELSLVLTGDDFVRALNRDYRGLDETTNVLSFPGEAPNGGGPAQDRPVLLGDVVVAFGVAQREAEADGRGTSLADHLSHLVIHGVLHLLGHDHQGDAEAKRMEGLETRLLSRLGIDDPYRDLDAGPGDDHESQDERRTN